MAMKRVRGQHLLTLTYKDISDVSTMKAQVKHLLSYVLKIANQKGWSAEIDVYFSSMTKNKNHSWSIPTRFHSHLIIDSCPSSTLIGVIRTWWKKHYGAVHIEDITPTIKDHLAVRSYCEKQALASKLKQWNRVIGTPLETLVLESSGEATDLVPVSVDAIIEPRNLLGSLLGSIDQHILLSYLVYSLNLNSPIAIQPSILLNHLYADRGSSDSHTPNLSLGDGMIDNLTPPPANQRNDVSMEELYILLSNLTLDDS